VVRPRSCRVIYYCDTPALGIRHQLFDRVTSSSSSEEDMFLGVDHGETSASTCDAASSSVVSQRKGDMPSQRGQFTRKYQAQWNDDFSM